ncbi:hypothetical protein P7K49_006676 [Saguinus oedipus]|uniref:Uncharacterized protein n=1 Tax=Saguinus oedipus TaxID=9490 RepID=A0ABQ9W3K7_SAGOE|nr:hypothetical protein P7K49_006676 [Saguinus oedipus]
MCSQCKDKFLGALFLYEDDGYQSYYATCCFVGTLLLHKNPDCTRCYCSIYWSRGMLLLCKNPDCTQLYCSRGTLLLCDNHNFTRCYCSICCSRERLLLCENPDCT